MKLLKEWHPQAQRNKRQRRLERYGLVMEKLREGMSQREIGRQLGSIRKTVRRWLQSR